MEEKQVADYFVVAGLPEDPKPLEDFSRDGLSPKATHSCIPITDIVVIIRSQGEVPPPGFTCIEKTPLDFPADLNHGSLRSPSIFLCYKRGRDKPPLVDIGVLYENKERVMADSEKVKKTPYDRPANVNNSGSRTFLTFRRARDNAPCNQLVVTDICVILTNKGETPPHAFCKIDRNLNKGMVGSDVYICYKKSMNRPDLLCYEPAILKRFPQENYSNFPLPPSVPLFCLPMGAVIESWPKKAEQPRPIFSTFVLTLSSAERVYGAAVSYYDRYEEGKLTDNQKVQLNYGPGDENEKVVFTNKSICVLSHWPFFDTFKKFLKYLYQMSVTGVHSVPLERYIAHFMLDIPFPSIQRPRILIQLEDESISLSHLEDNPMPLSGSSFIELLKNLGADNSLYVMLLALTEQKMLFHSLRQDVLTSVAEAVVAMIFPFHWQCPYIPLCPLGLSDVLSAPLPFLVGVDSRYFDTYDPPHEIACVDLDTNAIFLPEEKKFLNIKLLPKKPARILRNTLLSLYEQVGQHCKNEPVSVRNDMAPVDRDFIIRKKERRLELEIQEAFLRFMAAILKDFRSFLKPITKAPTVGTTDPSSLFDLQGFLKSRDKTYHNFFSLMMRTQMFTRFIEERSFVSDKDASLAFFDECSEKVDSSGDRVEHFLLDNEESHQNERTVFIAPPEPSENSPSKRYEHQRLDKLDFSIINRQPAISQLSVSVPDAPLPSSPVARRTKQEIKSALKVAKKQAETPMMWAKCLVGTCFSLWFIHLPSFIKSASSKSEALYKAYEVLLKMQKLKLHPPDEVCYRVMMLLCGQYSQPALAVKVLFEMKQNNVQPNAITYGYYNKAVLESKWPAADFNAALMWNKLRNVILGVAQFRQGSRRKTYRSISLCSELDYDRTSHNSINSSRTSIDENGQQVLPTNSAESYPDLIKVDDQSSSGGQSDAGYSSINQEEKCQSNSLNNAERSQDFTSTTKGAFVKKKEKSVRSLKFDELDFRESDEFRNRVRSIVRSSAGCFGSSTSNGTLLDDPLVNSAGLLITSEAMRLAETVLADMPNKLSLSSMYSRKRHRSAGDHHHHPVTLKNRNRLINNSECSSYVSEKETQPRQFLRSCSFGCDAQIIHKLRENGIRDIRRESLTKLEDSKCVPTLAPLAEASPGDKPEYDLLGSNNEDNQDDELLVTEGTSLLKQTYHHRPRSPNIPIKNNRRRSMEMRGSHSIEGSPDILKGSLSFDQSKDFITNAFSPFKEAWHNMDLSGSIPRVASSLTTSLGIKNRKFSLGSKVTRSSTFHGSHDKTSSLRSSPARSTSQMESLSEQAVTNTKPALSRSSTLPISPRRRGYSSNPGISVRSPDGISTLPASSSSFGISRLTSKHSEYLFDSLKSAATSMASKFTEIKQSLSATNTPTKGSSQSLQRVQEMDQWMQEDDEYSTSECNRRYSVDLLSRSDDTFDDSAFSDHLVREHSQNHTPLHQIGSAPSFMSHLADCLDTDLCESSPSRLAIDISMTSCSQCNTCFSLLYDEEIMDGWTADDSNLNTQCSFCNAKLVPVLTIIIKDLRVDGSKECLLTPAHSADSIHSAPPPSINFSQLVHSSNPLVQGSQALDRASRPGSVDSGNDTFLLFEDSPETGSIANGSSSETPLSSPKTATNGLEEQTGDGSQPRLPFTKPVDIFTVTTRAGPEDLIYLDSPASDVQGVVTSCNIHASAKKNATTAIGLSLNSLVDGQERTTNTPVFKLSVGSNLGLAHSIQSSTSAYTLKPITVPYLSPLVLRKEVENVLEHEGDGCLMKPEFVDQHPIIYWNLIWFFKRIGLQSHLPGFCLKASSLSQGRQIPENWRKADSRNVNITCLWDNLSLHENLTTPMYMLWGQNNASSLVNSLVTEERYTSKTLMNEIVRHIKCNDLQTPIQMLLNERQKWKYSQRRYQSIYRDLLFLAIVTVGRENIDQNSFDVDYRKVYDDFIITQRNVLYKSDKYPSVGAIFCRRYFSKLELRTVT